jgi:hypothetical protein
MKSVKITFGTSPAERTQWDKIESSTHFTIPANITITKTTLHIQLGTPPRFEPPPPIDTLLEQLREEYVKLVPFLTEQSQEILWFILETSDGWTTHEELIEAVWKKHGTESDMKPGTVHKAICVLNAKLKDTNFGYAITSRQGIYRLTPISR